MRRLIPPEPTGVLNGVSLRRLQHDSGRHGAGVRPYHGPVTTDTPAAAGRVVAGQPVGDVVELLQQRRVVGDVSQARVTAFALRFSQAAAGLSQPHTGRCATRRPHQENTEPRVTTSGGSPTSWSLSHCSVPPPVPTRRPSIRAPL